MSSSSLPELPQLESRGGPILAKPKLVPVTFPNDPHAATLERFVKSLAGSKLWKTAFEEYGVGAAVAGDPMRLTDSPPAHMTDDAVGQFIASKLLTGPADETTLFILYPPSGTQISALGGKSCEAFAGYHSEVKVGSKKIAYAVIPRCTTDLDTLTVATFHETAEAVTDPLIRTDQAFWVTDDFFAFVPIFGPEAADLCESGGQTKVDELGGAVVEGVWSNKLAKAGRQPCVPLTGAYFNAFPVASDPAQFKHTYLNGEVRKISTKGIKVPVGQTRTVDVHLSSDGKTSGEWSVQALDGAALRGGPAELALTLDHAKGKNGDTLHLTIKANKIGPEGFSTILLESKLGSDTNRWAVVVVQ